MDGHARGFIQDEEVLVFEEDVERNLFRLHRRRLRRRFLDPDHVARADDFARPHRLLVKQDVALLDQVLDPGTRQVRQHPCHEHIEPPLRVFRRHDDLPPRHG
jgi:hypothetical protein